VFRRGRREVGIAEVHVDPKPQDLTPSDRFQYPQPDPVRLPLLHHGYRTPMGLS
jgi:hypothetical protein